MFNNVNTCLLLLGLTLASISGFAQAKELPPGEGKELVESLCTSCHTTNRIHTSLGYNKEDWRALTSTMIDLSADPSLQQGLTKYLAEHFPPNRDRFPTLVSGDIDIRFREWVVPTLGQRSRDPVEAPDGKIWWAGQWGNLIGSIDADTGEMHEYPLPAGAMPHSVSVDKDGMIWYMGNKNGSVGRLNPDTGDIRVYPMPNDDATDPHTGVFDNHGILWFTLQHSNYIGRLDPASGDIQLKKLPTADARPYGIKIDASGNLWVACNGSNCLVSVNAETFELSEIKLPGEDTTVRRLDIAPDGMIWYVNSGLGKLGRYNPDTKNIKEWPSPSGPDSHPYAIAVLDGMVWYNESGMRPDALVRFDPTTERFQSWAIPSGDFYAGILRYMRTTPDGALLIHQSATNRIIRVDIEN